MENAECKWFPVCPMKFFFEKGVLDERYIASYCRADWKSCIRFQKEEAGIFHPDNMLPDGKIDENLS
ncbi:MAG: hypothetical protein KAU31_03615 [Spirochaetaceae bacterium]|nr:hypothetical protein [Spirochaetaceae bacterium]